MNADRLVLLIATALLAVALIAGASTTPPEPGPRDHECVAMQAGGNPDPYSAPRHVLVCRYGPLLCAYTLDVPAGFSCVRAGP